MAELAITKGVATCIRDDILSSRGSRLQALLKLVNLLQGRLLCRKAGLGTVRQRSPRPARSVTVELRDGIFEPSNTQAALGKVAVREQSLDLLGFRKIARVVGLVQGDV